MNLREKIKLLNEYFKNKEEVLMAFLFGSCASRKETKDSDIDIAVYLKPTERNIEWEQKKEYPEENIIWDEVEKITGRDTDLIILNRVSPILVYDILKNGIPLVIKDKDLLWKLHEIVERETEDFTEFMEDYLRIKTLSKSLTKEARRRLLQRFDYLLTYWPEKEKFLQLDFTTYQQNPDQRRNIERWVENITNVTLDIAKIILASEKKKMPGSYREVLFEFALFMNLSEEEAKKFSEISRLRNILAHEYLDILYNRIRDFLVNTAYFYERLIDFLKNYIEKT